MGKDGLPGGDRTPDPQLRRLMLYPTELRAEIGCAANPFFERIASLRGARWVFGVRVQIHRASGTPSRCDAPHRNEIGV